MTERRRLPAMIGVASVAAALGVAELVAIVTGPLTSPGIAVGGAIIDLVPEPLKQFAISLFGTYDKLALQIGTIVLLVLAGVGLGFLARRRLGIALGAVVAFALLGLVSALTRYDAGWTALFPSALAGAAGVLTLKTLTLRAAPSHDRADLALVVPPEPGRSGADPGTTTSRSTGEGGGEGAGRRAVLRTAGIVVAAGAVAGFGGRWVSLRRSVSADRAAVTLPAPASPAPALPATVETRLDGLARFVTPNGDFYRIDTALVVPQVAPDEWRLRIHGRVRNPITLTFDQLLARPMIERYVTLACVSNEVGGPLIGNARWLGVRISDLLAEADPEPGADQVVSRSVDGFTAGTPTEVLRDGRDAMLAVGMNGEPLPIEHGFPVRMVVPGLYGYVSATKWLAELELSSFDDFDPYWIKRGWAAKAPIKLQSRIDTPTKRATAGRVAVGGVAWAQHVGVSRVEVRVGDGAWQEAALNDAPSTDTWRLWTWAWNAPPGTYRLTVRAFDTAGNPQDETERPVLPDGATGLHSVEIDVA
jgi:DMSO/TMAO reductase YedYZ molybdopterin-dependent catalytic subunit